MSACGPGKGTYLVIPAANAELTAQAVGAGAVVHTRAVLRGRQGEPDPQDWLPGLPACPPAVALLLGSMF